MSIAKGRPATSTPSAREREWRQVLDRWKKSGLNGRAFCRRERLKESSFFFWKRQFRLREGRRSAPAMKFVPLKLPRPIGFFDVPCGGPEDCETLK